MRSIHEPARNVPMAGDYDVIVCGGGPAGFIAAVAAAREGAKTLLIERYGILGGTATVGLMVEFGSIWDGRQVIVGGVTHEFLHTLNEHGGADFRDEREHTMIFDPESMIDVCRVMTLEAGVELLLHALVVGPVVEAGRVTGVVTESKSGRQAWRAKAVIDATGDADVAARAGAGVQMGSAQKRGLQPVTLELILGNVDVTRVRHHRELVPQIRAGRRSGEWPIPTDQFFSWGRVKKRGAPDDPEHAFFFINATNALGIDGTSVRSLTEAELVTRSQVEPLVRFLRKYAPGFEACYLDRTAAQAGVRETRRIVGEYTLTAEDVLEARHFADGVVAGRNSIDVHDEEGKLFEHRFLREGTHYEIPYRCFVPAGIEGLLVCGRCLSADRQALGSVRVMVVCMPMGEACGLAAAEAAKAGGGVRDVAPAAIRKRLAERGTALDLAAEPAGERQG